MEDKAQMWIAVDDDKDKAFQMFRLGTPPKEARRLFREWYGVEPERVEDGGSVLLVGPIPEEDKRDG